MGGGTMEEEGMVLSTSDGTVVTGSGTGDVKGAYTELVSAANNTVNSVGGTIFIRSNGAEDIILLDIAIGGAGSEVVVVPNLMFRMVGTLSQIAIPIPVRISSGVRIAVRFQSGGGGSDTAKIVLHRFIPTLANDPGLSQGIDIGTDLASSSGTQVATSGSINTFGSWVELESSLSVAIKGFTITWFRDASSWTNASQTYQVAVGSAGNEEIIFKGQPVSVTGGEVSYGWGTDFIPVGIASGERIAIRAATSVIAGSDQNMDFAIEGYR